MPIELQRRMLYTPVFHIDANLINARQKIVEVNQLEKWYEDEVILINMSGTARLEARAGRSDDRKRKADSQIFTLTPPASPQSGLFKEVEQSLFPDGAQNENQRNDVRIVCDAIYYAAILVTNDGGSKSQPGGILGNRHLLPKGSQIMSPIEAVGFVRKAIRERDDFNQRVFEEFGKQLPWWTGHD